ncbi:MAG: zinc ribbon domain-containing protein [Burkholderiaceae bacterium]
MPIYAYRCAACGHTKDVLRKMSDPPLADCPACGEPRFEKQVTAAGFQLKGSGWYATDFRNPPVAAPKAGADGAKAEGGEATKTPGDAAVPAASAAPAVPASTSAAAAAAAPAAAPATKP